MAPVRSPNIKASAWKDMRPTGEAGSDCIAQVGDKFARGSEPPQCESWNRVQCALMLMIRMTETALLRSGAP